MGKVGRERLGRDGAAGLDGHGGAEGPRESATVPIVLTQTAGWLWPFTACGCDLPSARDEASSL